MCRIGATLVPPNGCYFKEEEADQVCFNCEWAEGNILYKVHQFASVLSFFSQTKTLAIRII